MKTLIVILQVLLSASAFASSPADGKLQAFAQAARANCAAGICHSGYELRTVYVFGAESVLSGPVITTLFGVAKAQAQIWGDTILEGDYRAKGDTRLDQISVLKRGGRVLAYRIVYSETARSPEGPGRIIEGSWVYSDLRTAITDDTQPATFRPHVR